MSTKERPILFSAPMVRALLDGTKTQTRRVVKEPAWATPHTLHLFNGQPWASDPFQGDRDIPCPYGQPGDRLWVKETWRTAASLDGKSPSSIAMSCIDAGYRKPWAPLAYEADGHRNSEWRGFELNGEAEPGKTRVSIHMPRWASRIDLEVTGVRVERLQDISDADARAEGATFHDGRGIGHSGWRHDFGDVHANARSAYARLWNDINGAGNWDANPWVWVVEFKRIDQGARHG